MTFNDFLNYVDSYYNQNKTHGIRYGQSIMNTLWEIWPSKYKEITNTDNDCFYDDRVCKITLDILEKAWGTQLIVE